MEQRRIEERRLNLLELQELLRDRGIISEEVFRAGLTVELLTVDEQRRPFGQGEVLCFSWMTATEEGPLPAQAHTLRLVP